MTLAYVSRAERLQLHRVLLVAALSCAVALACRGRAPDVAGLEPIRRADGRIVELLLEVDALAERDPAAAARNLRESVIPLAAANARALSRVAPEEARARRLFERLTLLVAERRATTFEYAGALETNNVEQLRSVLRRQAALDRDMNQLEGEIEAARRAPRSGGCGR